RPLTLLRICVCLFRRIGVAILLFGVLACWSRRALFSLRMVPLLLRSLLWVRLLLSRALLSRWIWVLRRLVSLMVSASWGSRFVVSNCRVMRLTARLSRVQPFNQPETDNGGLVTLLVSVFSMRITRYEPNCHRTIPCSRVRLRLTR